MRFKIIFFFSLVVVLLVGCIPERPKEVVDFNIDLKDRGIQLAYEAAYKMSKDTLYKLFKDPNPTIQYIAVNAFATTNDSTAIDSITYLLKSPNEMVRTAAAYTLGQIKHSNAESHLTSAFQKFDSLQNNASFNATVLEALGKCGTQTSLNYLSKIKSYRPDDTVLVLGLAKSLFQFSLRKMVNKDAISTMVKILSNPNYTNSSKIYAAYFMSRLKTEDVKPISDTLISLFRNSSSTLKIPLAVAISKINSDKAFSFINQELFSQQDINVRHAIASGMINLPYALGDTIAFKSIKDNDPIVARLGAAYIRDQGNLFEAKKYFSYFLDSSVNKACHIELLGALAKHLPYTMSVSRLSINSILKDSLLNVKDVYRKSDVIKSMAQDVTNYDYLKNVGKGSKDFVLKVSGVESMGIILSNPSFNKVFKNVAIPVKKQILSYLLESVLSADPGLVSSSAIILRDPSLNFKTFFPKDSVFYVALKRIKLPEGIEGYKELAKTIHYWNGKPLINPPKDGFRMLDWAVLTSLPDSLICILETNKGNIKLRLFPNQTPFAVANFVELIKRNYFNNKPFHRIVPNFVIQSGCNRGDGYGAMDYTIKSEFPQIYYSQAGRLGMASVGPNTESNQFFITSEPTPHLDGRYTMFGAVEGGLQLVHTIQRGDIVKKISLQSK